MYELKQTVVDPNFKAILVQDIPKYSELYNGLF